MVDYILVFYGGLLALIGVAGGWVIWRAARDEPDPAIAANVEWERRLLGP